MTTINPAECDRTTVYAGECRNFSDTAWLPFESGRRRSPNAESGNTWLVDVSNGSFWMADDKVRNLVPLVPARPIAREDQGQLWAAIRDELRGVYPSATDYDHRKLDIAASAAADAVVEHLNAHHPKPDVVCIEAEVRRRTVALRENLHGVEKSRDEWERKYHEVRRELADEQGRNWERHAAEMRIEQAERERDEWKARAEKAEASTAPAVTRADVERVVHRYIDGGFDELHASRVKSTTDAFMALLSGDDPAVYVVRESDLPEVEQSKDGWSDGNRHGWEGTAETAMECVETHLEWARFYFAAARAIEAEAQSPDPVEVKARGIAEAMALTIMEENIGGHTAVSALDALARSAARHVLGQEADDE